MRSENFYKVVITLALLAVVGFASFSSFDLDVDFKKLITKLSVKKEDIKSIDEYNKNLQQRQDESINNLQDSINQILAVKREIILEKDSLYNDVNILRDSIATLKNAMLEDGNSPTKHEIMQKIVETIEEEFDEELDELMAEKDGEIAKLEKQLSERDSLIYVLRSELQERDSMIFELNLELDKYKLFVKRISNDLPNDIKRFLQVRENINDAISELESANLFNRKKKIKKAAKALKLTIPIYEELNLKYNTNIFDEDKQEIKRIIDELDFA